MRIFPLVVAYVAAGGMYHVQIYGAVLQRGHLHPGRAAVGIYYRCPCRAAGRADHCGHCAGTVPCFRGMPAPGGLLDPLGLHPADRAGYHFSGCKTGGMLCSPGKGPASILKS